MSITQKKPRRGRTVAGLPRRRTRRSGSSNTAPGSAPHYTLAVVSADRLMMKIKVFRAGATRTNRPKKRGDPAMARHVNSPGKPLVHPRSITTLRGSSS